MIAELDDFGIFSTGLTQEEVQEFMANGPGSAARTEMTNIEYNEGDDTFRFTWSSKPNKTYSLFYSLDLMDFGADIDDSIESGGDFTTYPPIEEPGLANPEPGEPMLFFRAEENQ